MSRKRLQVGLTDRKNLVCDSEIYNKGVWREDKMFGLKLEWERRWVLWKKIICLFYFTDRGDCGVPWNRYEDRVWLYLWTRDIVGTIKRVISVSWTTVILFLSLLVSYYVYSPCLLLSSVSFSRLCIITIMIFDFLHSLYTFHET